MVEARSAPLHRSGRNVSRRGGLAPRVTNKALTTGLGMLCSSITGQPEVTYDPAQILHFRSTWNS